MPAAMPRNHDLTDHRPSDKASILGHHANSKTFEHKIKKGSIILSDGSEPVTNILANPSMRTHPPKRRISSYIIVKDILRSKFVNDRSISSSNLPDFPTISGRGISSRGHPPSASDEQLDRAHRPIFNALSRNCFHYFMVIHLHIL